MMRSRQLSLLLLLLSLLPAAAATRLKDIASLEGVRDNQLIGYGLVVGLNGTGDRRQTVFSAQTLTNLLERMGVSVSPAAIRVTNTAAVMVTATLPPYARSGSRIDVTVSAIGDASNLQGGVLLVTPLRGGDNQTYAVAQGPVVTGGFVAGGAGSSKTLNHPTVGRTSDGAIIERNAPSVMPTGTLNWQLRRADFTTASRIAKAIDARYRGEAKGQPVARAVNGGSITVAVPAAFREREVDFIAELESIPIDVDSKARVVVNERTGTIVMGKEVAIGEVSILHGALTVEVQTELNVSQPNPLSSGTTQVVPQATVSAGEEKAKAISLPKGATVETLVKALNAIGATARDVVAILQNLKVAGALDAELEVI